MPIMMISVDGETETPYYYLHDAQGSVVALLNNSGDVVEAYDYQPFGRPRVHTSAGTDSVWLTNDDIYTHDGSSFGNPFFFTARRMLCVDTYFDLGLYYYRARMYDPVIGRFLQPDPIGYADNMNMYAYCGNNPVNWVDPFGLAPWYDMSWIGFIAKGGFNGHWGEAGREMAKGAGDGAIITANAYTFGLISPLDDLASQKVSENGAFGKASNIFANISAAAAYSAVGMKAGGVQSKIALHPAHHKFPLIGKAKHLQTIIWRSGVKGSHKIIRIPYWW